MEPAQGASSSTTALDNLPPQPWTEFATDEDLIRGIDEIAASASILASYVYDPDELEQLKMEIAHTKQNIKENDYSISSALENRPIAVGSFGEGDGKIKDFDEEVASILSSSFDLRSPEKLEQLKWSTSSSSSRNWSFYNKILDTWITEHLPTRFWKGYAQKSPRSSQLLKTPWNHKRSHRIAQTHTHSKPRPLPNPFCNRRKRHHWMDKAYTHSMPMPLSRPHQNRKKRSHWMDQAHPDRKPRRCMK